MVAGLAVPLVGVAVIVARGSAAALLALSLNPGDLLILAATIVYSVYTIPPRLATAARPDHRRRRHLHRRNRVARTRLWRGT